MTPDASDTERIAFVTGRLAEPALRGLLESLGPVIGIDHEVIVLEISVAALMTPAWVARHLRGPVNADRLLLPGYCSGELDAVRDAAGIPVECGPKDLRGLPRWLQSGSAEPAGLPGGYGEHRIEIIAEINHAPELGDAEILAAAAAYRESGADVIDLGCNPGTIWSGIGAAVSMLRDEGHRVAVDTLAPHEIAAGAAAGAELVLSINGGNVDVARDLDCNVVVIPDDPRTLAGLDETVSRLTAWAVPHRIDPVVEPIAFGFAASLGRFIDVRRRYPDAAMLMGIGNITELTDVDSAGVNAVLVGFCEELSIGSVLSTEVINWARSSVREIDIARRLMFHAVSGRVLPKHVDPGLICLRDPEILEHGPDVLEELARRVRDPSYRLFAERGEIHVINRDRYLRGDDPFELFDRLEVDDASHAFYLGYEMAKALTALQLGKQYTQDQALRWGQLSVQEKSHLERKRSKPND